MAKIDARVGMGDLGAWNWRGVTAMNRHLVIAVVASTLAFGCAAASAQSPAAKNASEFTAPKKKAAPKRAPTRVIVRRAYPYHLEPSLYPWPDDVSWPGPNATRECVSRLVQERRPSGTVIVPRTHCWWQPK